MCFSTRHTATESPHDVPWPQRPCGGEARRDDAKVKRWDRRRAYFAFGSRPSAVGVRLLTESRLPKAGSRWGLLAQPKTADDAQISLAVLVAQIGQETGALADHPQQPAAAGVVLLVCAQVLRQLLDASRQQRHLHFGGPSVHLSAAVLANDLGLALLRDRHTWSSSPPVLCCSCQEPQLFNPQFLGLN